MAEYDDRHGDPDPIRAFVQHSPIPADARRLGLDRNTEEGAMVAMAGALNPAKWSHRIIAWLLLVTFALPFVLSLLMEIF